MRRSLSQQRKVKAKQKRQHEALRRVLTNPDIKLGKSQASIIGELCGVNDEMLCALRALTLFGRDSEQARIQLVKGQSND